jgi:putative transposase
MIATIRQALNAEGIRPSASQQPAMPMAGDPETHGVLPSDEEQPPIVQERFAQPIKQTIEENPSLGYRPVAHLLQFNKNTVQRILQLKCETPDLA